MNESGVSQIVSALVAVVVGGVLAAIVITGGVAQFQKTPHQSSDSLIVYGSSN